MKNKKIILVMVAILVLAIIGIGTLVKYKNGVSVRYVNVDDVVVEQIQQLDNGFTAIKFNMKNSNGIKGLEMHCSDNVLYITPKDINGTDRTKFSKEDKDINLYVSDKKFSKIIVKGKKEQKTIWEETDSKVDNIENLELVNNMINEYYDNENYPIDSINEVAYNDLVLNNYRIQLYTETVTKTTDEDCLYNYVTDIQCSSDTVFWIEAQDSNGNFVKVSKEYPQKSGNVSTIKIDKEEYAKKGTKLRLCMKNKTISKHFANISGRVDFR